MFLGSLITRVLFILGLIMRLLLRAVCIAIILFIHFQLLSTCLVQFGVSITIILFIHFYRVFFYAVYFGSMQLKISAYELKCFDLLPSLKEKKYEQTKTA